MDRAAYINYELRLMACEISEELVEEELESEIDLLEEMYAGRTFDLAFDKFNDDLRALVCFYG